MILRMSKNIECTVPWASAILAPWIDGSTSALADMTSAMKVAQIIAPGTIIPKTLMSIMIRFSIKILGLSDMQGLIKPFISI